MDDGMQQNAPTGAPQAPPPRSMPLAAVAGAIVLIGLVAFGLYRRHATIPAPEVPEADRASALAGARALWLLAFGQLEEPDGETWLAPHGRLNARSQPHDLGDMRA